MAAGAPHQERAAHHAQDGGHLKHFIVNVGIEKTTETRIWMEVNRI